MTIETIKAIVAQGAQAFADGKKTETNPYVNNPESHMHWLTGYNAAALAAAPQAEEPQTEEPQTEEPQAPESDTNETESDTDETESDTEEPTKTEGEQVEAKASKKSKE